MTIVVGAGMAGLLAAAMLRNECSGVIEAQAKIPNNHSAVLRFRSNIVSDVLNIPFKKVDVLKAAEPWRNPVADALAYSYKTNGTSTLRSITTADGVVSKRFIAPENLVQLMADRVVGDIKFGLKASEDLLKAKGCPIISTLPMPMLMDLLGWKTDQEFRSVGGVNITALIKDCDAYASLYVPDPAFLGSRISITGDWLIVECQNSSVVGDVDATGIAREACRKMGITQMSERVANVQCKEQNYAKILPISDNERKRFMLWATETYGVYSLGRFATWRPGLLLDDVVNDVRVIHKLINGGSSYDHRK